MEEKQAKEIQVKLYLKKKKRKKVVQILAS